MKSAQRIVSSMSPCCFSRDPRPRHDRLSHFAEESGAASLSRLHGDSRAGRGPGNHRRHARVERVVPSARFFLSRARCARAKFSRLPLRRRLPVRMLDKQTWKISLAGDGSGVGTNGESTTSATTLDYSIEWDDPGPFNSQLNAHHAFVNFAEVLMYVPSPPRGRHPGSVRRCSRSWHVAAELPAGPDAEFIHSAELRQAGRRASGTRQIRRIPIRRSRRAFSRSGGRQRLAPRIPGINSARHHQLRSAPDGRRSFQPNTLSSFISARIPKSAAAEWSTPIAPPSPSSSGDAAASVAAHEFFHAWNVKRIRPQTLEPVDYTKEMYTRALWFAEGVTSTYGAYTLERSGLWTKDQFYADLAGEISELDSRPAHRWQSVEESSLDAWLEKYDDYRRPERSISYYNKGQIVGVMLDLAIRDATDNHKSLDDVLRRMNDVYAKQSRFYDDSQGVEAIAEEVAGMKFDDFFRPLRGRHRRNSLRQVFRSRRPATESRTPRRAGTRLLDRSPWRRCANARISSRARHPPRKQRG